MKFWSKILFPLLTMFVLVVPASAQTWPMPGKGSAVQCAACPGAATGKLTVPFNDPLVRHVGRYVDSSGVMNVQNMGMRTVRAREIRSYLDQDVIAVALGEGVGLYNVDTFFTATLGKPLVSVDKAFNMNALSKFGRYADPFEKLLPPDAFFYAESGDSGWVLNGEDTQRQLESYDMDDRGYFYVATVNSGWGISKYTGQTGARHVDFVNQVGAPPFKVDSLFSIRAGSRYYAVVTQDGRGSSKLNVYDTTSPTNAVPRLVASREGYDAGWAQFDKHDGTQRLAIVTADSRLVIYDYSTFVAPGSPTPLVSYTPTPGRQFADISFDEDGRLWVAEKTAAASSTIPLWKLSPSGNSYTKETYGVAVSSSISPAVINAGGGYVAVIGTGGAGAGSDVMLMKVEGGVPQPIDLENYFRNYYSKSPGPGYAALDYRTPSYFEPADVQLVKSNNKVYLMYSAGALADVYELQAGESISVSMVANSFGTANPNARSTESGPFYGDILKFKATSSAPRSFSLNWDFGNPESGNDDGANSGLNETVIHQFTGLQTAASVVTPKAVKAQVVGDATVSDTLNVTLKLPKARITIPGREAAMTSENKGAFEVVAGDEFEDASDGVVEGHFSGWNIDGTEVKKLPTATMDVGALGSHSLAFTAYYGKYNEAAMINNAAYKSVINNVTYHVKPFIATIRPPVSTTTEYIFNADARVTTDSALLTATQWTVTWSVGGAANLTTSSVETIGVIPPYPVAKSSSLNGKFVTLQIAVDPITVPGASFATYVASQKLEVPDIQINKTTGCTAAGEPCTLTAVPAGSGSSANWQLQWTIKRGNTNVAAGSSNPITFTPSEQGTYTASVTETAYGITQTLNFPVSAPTCGPLPPVSAVDIGWSCTTCLPNVPIDIEAGVFPNTVQPCHQFVWDFGDSTTGTGQGTKHTYPRTGNFKIKLTIKTATSTSNTVLERTITIGTEQPPPPTCSLPIGIDFVYSGNQGCSSTNGVACKTNELVTFTGKRIGGANLASCDNAAWTIDGVPYGVKSPKHTFATTGNKTVSLTVSNSEGTAEPVTKTLNIAQGSTGGGSCTTAPTAAQIGITFAGVTSNCGAGSATPCKLNEVIEFTAELFEYTQKSCDFFEWTFGDSTPVVLGRQTTHTYTGARNSARVKLRVYNTANPTGVTHEVDVPFTTINEEPAPVLSAATFPRTGAKGTAVTFTATSNISATGWSWNFDDGTAVDNSQSGVVGTTTTITHTFTKTGTFNVRVTARRAGSPGNAQTNFAIGSITITDTPEYKYLVLASRIGTWRTDVQIYNPDPAVSPSKPLRMSAQLRDMTRTLEVFDSTHIYEDFIGTFTNGSDQGAIIITANTQYPPQIWTRTYSQTESGTFGQFIPAIRIDQAGGGAAIGTGKYYIAGLRANARYRTNLGMVNPTSQPLPVTVAVYDDMRAKKGQFTRMVDPFQLLQFDITTAVQGLEPNRPFSVELSVPDGQWLIGYCSFIDGGSTDPVYIQAVRESVLNSPDYRNGIVPGVGHVGAWRSDVTVFNPNTYTVNVDLAYHDASGAKKGEALAVPIRGGEFLQYDDILKQGVFGNVADGLGMLRVTLPTADDTTISPMTFARTYADDGSGKTYGQGIRGFAAAQANVKPGKPALIAGIRKNSKYRTNIGLSNVSNTEATVLVKVLDPSTGAEIRTSQFTLKPLESIVAPDISLEGRENASIRVEVTGGHVWAFGSMIDRLTADPEYIEAVPLQ